MKPVRIHHPGAPTSTEPPDRLLNLADTIVDPSIVQCGITTTDDGRWALYVTVPADMTVPIESVERVAEGFPVVYEAELSEPVRAGPAFPSARGKRHGRR